MQRNFKYEHLFGQLKENGEHEGDNCIHHYQRAWESFTKILEAKIVK